MERHKDHFAGSESTLHYLLRNFATDLLPTLHSNIDILAINVDAVADALAQAGCAPNSAGIAELLPQGVHIEDFGHLRLLRTCRGSYC